MPTISTVKLFREYLGFDWRELNRRTLEVGHTERVFAVCWALICLLILTWRFDMYDHNVFGIDLYYYSYIITNHSFLGPILPAGLSYENALTAPGVADFYSSYLGNKTTLAEHFAPSLFTLTPFAGIFHTPLFLISLGVICHYIATFNVFYLARLLLPGPVTPLVLAAVYGLNPALLAIVIEPNGGWYLDSMAPPLTSAAAIALLTHRLKLFGILTFAIVCVKPNLAVYAVLVGIWLGFCGLEFRRIAAATFLAGAVMLFVAISFPTFIEANATHVSMLRPFVNALLTDPLSIFSSISPLLAFKAVLLIALPFAPVLLFPPIIALVLPDVLLMTFAHRHFAHNWFSAFTILSVGSVIGLYKFRSSLEKLDAVAGRAVRAIISITGVGLCVASLVYAHTYFYRIHVAQIPDSSTIPYDDALALAKEVPSDKWLATNVQLGRVLFDRLNWAILDTVDADYVMVLSEPVFDQRHANMIAKVKDRAEKGRLRLIKKQDRLSLFVRTP